jgi:hypothetical protein
VTLTAFTNDLPNEVDSLLDRLSRVDGIDYDSVVITSQKCQLLVREFRRLREEVKRAQSQQGKG